MLETWLLLQYQIPTQPTARRVYVWRKLKRLGAFLWQESVWILPDRPRTREQFQWLAAEIIERGGEATLWGAHLLLPAQDETLVQQFLEQSDATYEAILKELNKKTPDLAALSRQYQQAQATDYFQAPVGRAVRKRLLSARGDK